jgi:hypothetical protein
MNMLKTIILTGVIPLLFLSLTIPPELDKAARKKLDGAVKAAFGIEDYRMEPFGGTESLTRGTESLAGETESLTRGTESLTGGTESLFRIINSDSLCGYAWIGKAPGRYDDFDFTVIYSPDWLILQVEILVYRSDHGFEITNKRWLAQFKGSNGCELRYGKDIDALAGATISGNSLVSSVSRICEQIPAGDESQAIPVP